MLGPMTPITDALSARAIEEAAVRAQEEQRRKEAAQTAETLPQDIENID